MTRILLPFSWVYGFAAASRNLAFERGWLREVRIGVPVISVGNVTAGGTGKTPLVEFILGRCLRAGRKVGVVSRGYRRMTKGVVIVSDGRSVLTDANAGGDEPVQIARRFPAACVVVGERRVEAARTAVRELGVDLIVMDDGFQHRYLHRDLDIVVADSGTDLTREPMLPAGMRREPLSGMRRAHLVAFSKVPPPGNDVPWRRNLDPWYRGPWATFRYRMAGLHRLPEGKDVSLNESRKKPVLVFTGIGDHGSFVRDLANGGWDIRAEMRFPDHHRYTPGDCARIVREMDRHQVAACVTTEKDAVRLGADPEVAQRLWESSEVLYPRIDVEILRGEETLTALIDRYLSLAAGSVASGAAGRRG